MHEELLAGVSPVIAPDFGLDGARSSASWPSEEIRRQTVLVAMRDGVRLSTDVYLPPTGPCGGRLPVMVVRTPYGRANPKLVEPLIAFAQHGYAVVMQDCRGTGDSEPDRWDYYVYEREDSFDCVEWIVAQEWFGGFLAGCGGSYLGATQWCMALHPKMSAIAPEVCGLGIAPHTVRNHMFVNAYSRSVGKGAEKVAIPYDVLERQLLRETLAGGYFNDPLLLPFSPALCVEFPWLRALAHDEAQRRLWEHYCTLAPSQRAQLLKLALGERDISPVDIDASSAVFGHSIAHDAHLIPSVTRATALQSLQAPALMITGWYDWFLDDALATWEMLQSEAQPAVRSRSRLLITPSAHLTPGYHEGGAQHPELSRLYRTHNLVGLLLRWHAAVRADALESWPVVIYYLMGANEWRTSAAWPPPETQQQVLYLGAAGMLSPLHDSRCSACDEYTYDPAHPTPTVGGSIISFVYPPGSVDVGQVQRRPDVLTYSTEPLARDLDVVGAIRLILYVSSTAQDTDFCGRLSDVFPDGRAIQLQSGILRTRYRDADEPRLMEPGRIYRLEIDLWSTANRFRPGHRLRLDISSADFPRFDRHSNRAGEQGGPVSALQTIHRGGDYPSHLIVSILGKGLVPQDDPPDQRPA